MHLPELPIYDILPALQQALVTSNAAVLQAPPGAGKSTILPLALIGRAAEAAASPPLHEKPLSRSLSGVSQRDPVGETGEGMRMERGPGGEAPWLAGQKIIMLEPRRLAAKAVATRMAWHLGEEVGQTVGYRVRFESKVSKHTRIEVLTEGILTRMLQQDNALEGIGAVIFDEFHERSLHADLALALCREAQQILREDLRLLVMSATLDGAYVSALLGNCPILTSEGRQHPVDIRYRSTHADQPAHVRMARALEHVLAHETGDILAFLPGAGEISRTQEALALSTNPAEVAVLPLYGDLPQQEQQRALLPLPGGKRKIVLATSIAETSLTIEGIRVVVDSGLARVPRFDPRSGLTRLDTAQVTRDAADQRSGRAGRLGPGVSYRLWSEATQAHLVDARVPEILEADLAPLALELAQWGVRDVRTLAWPTPPPAGALAQARDLLLRLEALDEQGNITPRGKEMLRLPTHPRIAHMLLVAQEADTSPNQQPRFDSAQRPISNPRLPGGENRLPSGAERLPGGVEATSLACDVAALLEERDPLPRESGADLTLRVEALHRWRNRERTGADRAALERIERVSANWRRMMRVEPSPNLPDSHAVGRLVAAAYPERIAKQRSPRQPQFKLSNGRNARVQDHDPLVGDGWLAIAHLDAGTAEGKIFLAAPVHPEDLPTRTVDVAAWDAKEGILVMRRERRVGDLPVSSEPLTDVPESTRVAIVCEAIREGGMSMLPWTESLAQWQARILSLRTWRPDEAWPDVSSPTLLDTLETWLGPYLGKIRRSDDLQRLPLADIVHGLLPWPLPQQLNQLAPLTITVPTGSEIRLEYFTDGRAPILAVRLQEVFGLTETPTVNDGRTRVLMHLLSPGYKPVQVTQDLHSFWQNTYAEVRKDLRGRYPKHSWPEDPWTAEAIRGAKKRVQS